MQRGFYAEQALDCLNKFQVNTDTILLRADPRSLNNPDHFVKRNIGVKLTSIELMDEIKTGVQKRAEQRGMVS